jgi:hypothetical protein
MDSIDQPEALLQLQCTHHQAVQPARRVYRAATAGGHLVRSAPSTASLEVVVMMRHISTGLALLLLEIGFDASPVQVIYLLPHLCSVHCCSVSCCAAKLIDELQDTLLDILLQSMIRDIHRLSLLLMLACTACRGRLELEYGIEVVCMTESQQVVETWIGLQRVAKRMPYLHTKCDICQVYIKDSGCSANIPSSGINFPPDPRYGEI